MKSIYLITICLVISLIISVLVGEKVFVPKKTHEHAGFVVYDNGKKLDFSDFKYMRVKPCLEEEHESTLFDIGQEKAHLHDFVGDIVHMERERARWGDLFRNIRYRVDDKDAVVYINGKLTEKFENVYIRNYDNAVILIGDNGQIDPEKVALKTEYIIQKAQTSVECGT